MYYNFPSTVQRIIRNNSLIRTLAYSCYRLEDMTEVLDNMCYRDKLLAENKVLIKSLKYKDS